MQNIVKRVFNPISRPFIKRLCSVFIDTNRRLQSIKKRVSVSQFQFLFQLSMYLFKIRNKLFRHWFVTKQTFIQHILQCFAYEYVLKHFWINLICILYLNLKICFMYMLFSFSLLPSCQSSFKIQKVQIDPSKVTPCSPNQILSSFFYISYPVPTKKGLYLMIWKMKATVTKLVWDSFQSCRPKNFKLLLRHFIVGKEVCRTRFLHK